MKLPYRNFDPQGNGYLEVPYDNKKQLTSTYEITIITFNHCYFICRM